MTPALLVIAVLVATGAVVAVSAREPRFAALGVIVALVGSGYLSDPLPGTAALGARLVGSVLAAYLVWVALRRAPVPTSGSSMGWQGATAIAIVAFLAGWLGGGSVAASLVMPTPEGPTLVGPTTGLATGSLVARAALADGFVLVALAAGPVLIARDVLRLGLGLLLLVAAAGLFHDALAGASDDVVELAIAVVIAAGGAGVAGTVARSIHLQGDLLLRGHPVRTTAVRHRVPDDAHPAARRTLGIGR